MTRLLEMEGEAGNDQDGDNRHPKNEAKFHNPPRAAGLRSPGYDFSLARRGHPFLGSVKSVVSHGVIQELPGICPCARLATIGEGLLGQRRSRLGFSIPARRQP